MDSASIESVVAIFGNLYNQKLTKNRNLISHPNSQNINYQLI
jgi:hypothetical protein